MEKAAKNTLRQLKEACLQLSGGERTNQSYSYFDEVGTMVTVSTLALQGLSKEEGDRDPLDAGSDSLSSLLESVILEGLEEIATREVESAVDPFNGRFLHVDNLWSHCLQLVQSSSDILGGQSLTTSLISSACQFSLYSSRLLNAFLSVGKAVLTERQLLSLLSHLHDKFWSREAKRIAEKANTVTATDVQNVTMETSKGLNKLVKLIAASHCILSMHKTVAESLSDHGGNEEEEERGGERVKEKSLSVDQNRIINLWLCRGTLIPLLDTLSTVTPKLLWSAFTSVVEVDKRALEIGACTAAVPNQLKMVDLLMSAISCLVQLSEEVDTSPIPKEDAPLIITFVATETTLRLVNHCWDELTKLIKQVPCELPTMVLYLVLSSFVRLHNFLSESDLVLNEKQKETHSHLLHTLSESCDGVREQIISYHTQLTLTSLLHDASSQDWNSTKPFFEGERSSYCVQMYCYHMKGLKHDLCTLVAPWSCDLAEKILLSVMSSSLSHLARRYSSTTPSHARVNQFRADILSILATVLSLQPQLRNKAHSFNNQFSPETTLIHRSCNQLLTVLAIGACPLPDLEEVLSQLSPSLPTTTKSVGEREIKGGENKRKYLFRGVVGDCSCQWVSILERHRSIIAGTTEQLGVDTSLYGHLPNAQVAAAALSFPCRVSNGNSRGGRPTDIQKSQTPPKTLSAALLQSLLLDHASLAVQLCKNPLASESLVVDVTTLLSLCWHEEWALSFFYKGFRNARGLSSGDHSEERASKEEEAIYNWLAQLLQIKLESYVLSMSAGLHGNLQDKAKVWQNILSTLNGLGERLSSLDLPISIINLIWTMADDISEREVCSKGDSLAKLLAFLVSRWSTLAHHRLEGPLGALLSAHCSSITYTLGGKKPAQGKDRLPQDIEEVINSHRTELQSWLNRFDQFLPRPGGGCDQSEESTLTECEAAWEVIKEDDVMVTSLKCVHSALVKWWHGSETVGFNPQGEYSNVPSMEMIDNIDWKVLVGEVIEGCATTPTICNILETVRWEFQDGASRSLEEREAELIKAVRTHLHYKDDCTV